MYKTVDPFYEPILDERGTKPLSEMTKEQTGFLCGLIKGKKPKKIVEVGVAAGVTTRIILKCMEMLNLFNRKLYSVDLSDFYYKDETKKTGYIVEQFKNGLKMYDNYTLLTGKLLAERIDMIAPDRDIAFLILDTVHSLPGELLDFILCLPYLKKGATVVLHDIRLNHQDGEFQAFTTKIVFDVVTAEKYLLWKKPQDSNQIMEIDSIGAFDIIDDTSKYIVDLFSALTITWIYPPGDYALDTYRKVISRNYNTECMQMWDSAVKMQKETMLEKYILEDRGGITQFTDLNKKWNAAQKVCIYGFGYKGKMYLQYATQKGLRVDAIVLSDYQSNGDDNTVPPVISVSELSFSRDECSFINAGERQESIKEIENSIRYAGYYKIM